MANRWGTQHHSLRLLWAKSKKITVESWHILLSVEHWHASHAIFNSAGVLECMLTSTQCDLPEMSCNSTLLKQLSLLSRLVCTWNVRSLKDSAERLQKLVEGLRVQRRDERKGDKVCTVWVQLANWFKSGSKEDWRQRWCRSESVLKGRL